MNFSRLYLGFSLLLFQGPFFIQGTLKIPLQRFLCLAELLDVTPGLWFQVLGSWKDSPYLDNSFVYCAKNAGEPFAMGERTVNLLHESAVKLTMPRDTFKPKYESVATTDFMTVIERNQRDRSNIQTVPAEALRHLVTEGAM